MLKLRTRRAAAMAAATLTLAGGAMFAAAGTASATIGCTGGSGCNNQTTIYFNDTFYPNSNTPSTMEWHSPTITLKMQTDGNLVLYCVADGSAVWATGTNLSWSQQSSNYRKVQFQRNGNMTIWNFNESTGSQTPAWNTNTPNAYEAIVQVDGNFVIYDGSGNALWSSGTYHRCGGTAGYWG
ncbi:hypothetical protein [Streptacidiphilus neutrinimicus]|uniref:hypothetical protein n=1 Tax=Streptacidiphilus neutrinimicus TaxID=105420 RepID=UPI0005A64AB1|nr:hypothetical protein [Streptacidiphilus neutrinimicus]